MAMFKQLRKQYNNVDCRDLGSRQLEQLRDGLKGVTPDEIISSEDGKAYIDLLRKFREAVAENDKLHGENYPVLLNSLLSVGEDGLYSNNLCFIFELIQNVDDCDYRSPDDCRLDMHFDFNSNEIVLTYNEVGFTPFNVFAITGIAEAAKNISSDKNEIGEKGIGFKSVFGVAEKVLIQSGWFSFELYKENFTIPVSAYNSFDYCQGTQMTLYIPNRVKQIYGEIKKQYCRKDALFSRNPLIFLNKLTSLKMYFDTFRSMEFNVSRSGLSDNSKIEVERDVELSVNLHDYENGTEIDVKEQISCSRYTYPVVFSRKACQSRYGENTRVGKPNGKPMTLCVILPNQEHISDVGKEGVLYSFLPTQIRLTVPLVCHVPFKLDASREFVDPQSENLWFQEASNYLSKLIDYVYMDWRNIVKEEIVQYVPGAKYSLFDGNNGKEQCLRGQSSFRGTHYLDLPLFFTIDKSYHKANEIICFEQEEEISEPEKVHRLMGYESYLFNPSSPISKFGFKIERNVKDKLFKRLFTVSAITFEALEYLDSVNYTYSEDQLPDQSQFSLTSSQIETMLEHRKLASLLQSIACNRVKNNRYLKISVTNATELNLADVLYDDFELSETPRPVEKYMRDCDEKCICLNIEEDNYLPCRNAVILSQKNPLSSFAAFCRAIDQRDIFVIRINLREASEKLNRYVDEETCSAADYLRNLQNIRLTIKDSLGEDGYRSYIDLILKSGTDRGRFIQELLQNADDCDYLSSVIPTFSLIQKGDTVYTEYNEIGFNRANIRSITAIGESTKNKLFNGEFAAIGEKGVGFKSIFSVASKVRIYSGEYSFSLTDREPTIPRKALRHDTVVGTKMEIVLKDQRSFPTYNEKALLELCLCLRKLRLIRIGSHSIFIEDSDTHRTITIGKRQYVFKRFKHTFNIMDENALKERRSGNKAISSEQSIICFVPEKGGLSDYALYSGLPTKHRIKIPMVIDAPFALTTSREEIETESSAWNNIIRKELYAAIISVMDSLKTEERAKIFRFTKFVPRLHGNVRAYVNDISDCSYLTSYDFLNILKSCKILPTFDREVFKAPQSGDTYRFPDAATFLFRKVPQSEYAGIQPSDIIDVEGTTSDEIALNALECEYASFRQVFPIIKTHAERFIQQEEFRSKLYELLQEVPVEFKEKLKNLAIIPVYGQNHGSVEYINWKEDRIFVKKRATKSTADYYALNEKLLSKTACEQIFDFNINEINAEWERSRYNERLNKIVHGNDIEKIYNFLIAEFQSGALRNNDSFATLYAISDRIPLKNELGEIVNTNLFLCDQPPNYFDVGMIKRLIVNKECAPFAKFMRCSDLSGIHYDDIEYDEMLTAYDVEGLNDDYFVNSKEILRGFYRDGLLSDELLKEYELEYLAIGYKNDYEESYQFPCDPVSNRDSLRKHVRELWRTPIKVVSVKEERTIQKGRNIDGSTFDLGIKDTREGALRIYTPEGANKMCFCQMCHKVKPHRLIEVNNIEVKPQYYFPQLRIALCLECSKRFEYLRDNAAIRAEYIEAIKRASIQNEGTVDVPIGHEVDKITFTAKHLAEIQEILKQMPEQK